MCWKVVCQKCKKYTWDGCGKHIEQVRNSVPKDQWCECKREEKPKKN
jgi:hypothetical protein